MRITKACVLFLAILVVALLTVLPSHAAEVTQITASDIFDPLGVLGQGPIGQWLDAGTITCPGHQPTGSFPPCPAGSRTNYRGVVVSAPFFSTDPRLNGWETYDINENLDANGEGTYWGKWRIEVNDGGFWEGNYNGKMSIIGGILSLGIEKSELHGTGGFVDGLLLKMDGVVTAYFGGLAYTGASTGYILDPHAK
jgi:hypothetical protein